MKKHYQLVIVSLFLACPVWAQLTPFVDSVVYDPVTDFADVSWGYSCTGSTAVTYAIGPENLVSPPPSNQGQPTTFQPGTHHNVFSTTFSLQATTTQRWILDGNSAVASPTPTGLYDAPVTYQGALSVGGQPVNGLTDFQFTLYNAATNGSQIYGSERIFDPTNTAAVGGPVMVSNGLFTVTIPWQSVQLGSGTVWLGIQARYPSGVSNYVPIWPRQQLTYVPAAANAQMLGGLPASSYAQASVNYALLNGNQQFSGSNTLIGPNVITAASVNIGITNGEAPLAVNGSASGLEFLSSTSMAGTWLGLYNGSSGGMDWQLVSTGSGNSEGPGELLFIGASGFVSGGAEPLALTANGATVNGTFNNNSDRNAKQNFTGVDPDTILDQVSRLPLTQWSYKSDPATRHIGPMAQDFYSAFKVGTDDRHIAPIDEGGVALAAIQSLDQKLREKNTEIEQLRQQNDSLAQRMADLEAAMKTLHTP